MVTTDWQKFREFKDNGLVKDVFSNKSTMDKLTGEQQQQQQQHRQQQRQQQQQTRWRMIDLR
jgi:glutamine phosphoribosylpyrophosphate amidotransferase